MIPAQSIEDEQPTGTSIPAPGVFNLPLLVGLAIAIPLNVALLALFDKSVLLTANANIDSVQKPLQIHMRRRERLPIEEEIEQEIEVNASTPDPGVHMADEPDVPVETLSEEKELNAAASTRRLSESLPTYTPEVPSVPMPPPNADRNFGGVFDPVLRNKLKQSGNRTRNSSFSENNNYTSNDGTRYISVGDNCLSLNEGIAGRPKEHMWYREKCVGEEDVSKTMINNINKKMEAYRSLYPNAE